jgi:hypothetical protein
MNNAPNTYSAPVPLSTSYTPTTYGTNAADSGFKFLNMSLMTWFIIILILAILGFNIFVYLAKGTQTFSDVVGPYIKYFVGLIGYTSAEVTKTVTETAATGTKAGVDLASGTITSGVDIIQETSEAAVTGANAKSSLFGSQKTNASVPREDSSQDTRLNSALKNSNSNSASSYKYQQTFNADDATSEIQSNKSSSKSGWCYIGESRGLRSCVQVGENDRCMSGDIFPSQEICVNPRLRA